MRTVCANSSTGKACGAFNPKLFFRFCAMVVISIFLGDAIPMFGQDPKHQPDNWVTVRYDHQMNLFVLDGKPTEEYLLEKSSSRMTANFWRIFADKEGVELVDNMVAGTPTGRKLKFGEQLYVFSDHGGWVKVGSPDKQKAEGWCRRDQLILWSQPLVDNQTGIELKAFLVNQLNAQSKLDKREYDGDLKQKYEVFDGPGKDAAIVKTNFLYDVLYVYKYDKGDPGTGPRWLLGASPELSSATPLLGWVSREKVKVWATRLCLEPNFDPGPMAERKEKDIRAKLFPQVGNSEPYLQFGRGKGLVDGSGRDPAFNEDPMASRRMDGKLFRYPVPDASMLGDDNCSFHTGVSARMNVVAGGTLEGFNEEVYLKARKHYEALQEQKEKVGIVFVVEGSTGLQGFGKVIGNAIKGIKEQFGERVLKFGAVYYRNEFSLLPQAEDPESQYLEELHMTNDLGQVQKWIAGRTAYNAGDPGEERAAHLALERAFGILQRHETNIIIHLCARPDNSDNGIFSGKTLVTASDLGSGLDLGKAAHYLGYVVGGADDVPSAYIGEKAFTDQQSVMEQLAVSLSNQLKGLVDFGKGAAGEGRAVAPVGDVQSESNGSKVASMNRQHFVMRSTLWSTVPTDLGADMVKDVKTC